MPSGKDIPPENLEAFRRTLRRWLEDARLSQNRAAELLGVSQTHISALLRGSSNPGMDFLVRARRVSGIPLDDWLGFPTHALSPRGIAMRLKVAIDRELASVLGEDPSNSTD